MHGGAVLIHLDERAAPPEPSDVDAMASLPFIVVAVTPPDTKVDPGWRDLLDVIVGDDDPAMDDIAGNITNQPRASTTLALLLRAGERRTLGDALVAESAAYSTLQGGPEFAAWRAARPVRAPAPTPRTGRGDEHDDHDLDLDVDLDLDLDPGRAIRCERDGGRLLITLDRPEVRNALDARMRDELVESLRIAALDRTITTVELRGEGPAFCAGGDLDEFGSRADPATGHLIRLHRSVARAIAAISDRVVAHLHGACFGSGIELPAFAGTVLARDDTRIALPEIRLGLIPGAGGTFSLPRRIGRHRTAWLALSGRAIDAGTALRWGLVDDLEH